MLPASQARHHKIVHLVELPVGVPRPEIVPPAAKHGRQFRDDLLHFLPVLPLVGQLSHAIPKFLRRLRTGPPLHEMPTGIPLDAPPLANRASQEYKALPPAPQIHQPRLRRMQRQTEPIHDQPDPPEPFPGLRFRFAHHHEIVGISNQNPERATSPRPSQDLHLLEQRVLSGRTPTSE